MKKFLAFIFAVAMTLVWAAPASAVTTTIFWPEGTVGNACPQPSNTTYRACFTDDSFGGSSVNNWVTLTAVGGSPGNISDLRDIPYNHSGYCHAVIGYKNWQDCISGFRIWLPPNAGVKLYTNINYGGDVFCNRNKTLGYSFIDAYSMTSTFNDKISSIKFFWTLSSC
jgi:hypothetical protein